MTSFRSRCQVVSTELVPPVVIVPSAKIQSSSFGEKTYRHTRKVADVNSEACFNEMTGDELTATNRRIIAESL